MSTPNKLTGGPRTYMSVDAYRAVVPRRAGCAECTPGAACHRHALETALVVADVMTDSFLDATLRLVEAELELERVRERPPARGLLAWLRRLVSGGAR